MPAEFIASFKLELWYRPEQADPYLAIAHPLGAPPWAPTNVDGAGKTWTDAWRELGERLELGGLL